jgi:hypothetical protein
MIPEPKPKIHTPTERLGQPHEPGFLPPTRCFPSLRTFPICFNDAGFTSFWWSGKQTLWWLGTREFSSLRWPFPWFPMAACFARNASVLGCQMSFAGRRSRRLGQIREREESLGADGVYSQLPPEHQYLSCELKKAAVPRDVSTNDGLRRSRCLLYAHPADASLP